MAKSIFNKQVAEEIISRIQKLAPDLQPFWGKMTPSEMLAHCNISNSRVLNWDGEVKKAKTKQLIAKLIFLKLMPRFPKNAKTPTAFDMKGKIDQKEFELNRKKYIDIIREFGTTTKDIYVPHPYFGPLNKKEWGVVVFRHMDHHLRQFGC